MSDDADVSYGPWIPHDGTGMCPVPKDVEEWDIKFRSGTVCRCHRSDGNSLQRSLWKDFSPIPGLDVTHWRTVVPSKPVQPADIRAAANAPWPLDEQSREARDRMDYVAGVTRPEAFGVDLASDAADAFAYAVQGVRKQRKHITDAAWAAISRSGALRHDARADVEAIRRRQGTVLMTVEEHDKLLAPSVDSVGIERHMEIVRNIRKQGWSRYEAAAAEFDARLRTQIDALEKAQGEIRQLKIDRDDWIGTAGRNASNVEYWRGRFEALDKAIADARNIVDAQR